MADLSLDLSAASSSTFLDLLVVNGDLVMTSDLQAGGTDPVLQDVLQTLKWVYSEWFLDILSGAPYFQEILVPNPDQDKINAVMMSIVLSVPGVVAITYFNATPNVTNRKVTLKFNGQKTTGKISYDGTLDF